MILIRRESIKSEIWMTFMMKSRED